MFSRPTKKHVACATCAVLKSRCAQTKWWDYKNVREIKTGGGASYLGPPGRDIISEGVGVGDFFVWCSLGCLTSEYFVKG